VNIQKLPAINALLNLISGLFIIVGWWFIYLKRKKLHVISMLTATVTSIVFLISYLVYHFNTQAITHFTATGIIRLAYFALLISHVALAFSVPPLVVLTLIPAIYSRFDKHRCIAKWTLPIWLYVSVTGVLVYMILYRWWPSTESF
jgi:putative membrane protein